MQNGRKTSMNTRQPRPAAPFVGRRWSPNAVRPEQNGSHNARRNYERYLALAQAEAQTEIQSGQKTTTSTPNIISDRCPQI